jgi:hypothetical protein
MKYILLILVLALMALPAVNADVLMPGTKGVGYCFRISNIEDYPDYEFVMYGDLVSGLSRITPGECVSFYKFDQPKIYAFDKNEFENFKETAEFDGIHNYNRSKALEYISQAHEGFYASDLEINDYGTVDESNPLDSVEDIFTIKSLAGNKVEIEKTSVVYTYEDGKTETKPYVNGERPNPSRKVYLPFSWYLIFIPIAAALLIFWILKKRKNELR